MNETGQTSGAQCSAPGTTMPPSSREGGVGAWPSVDMNMLPQLTPQDLQVLEMIDPTHLKAAPSSAF